MRPRLGRRRKEEGILPWRREWQITPVFSGESHGHVAGRGDSFQGPKLGSCLTLRNELSADKARDFIGKGPPGGEK